MQLYPLGDIFYNMNKKTKEQYISNISLKIKEQRKKIGLTQVEFAKRVGVGLRFLRELEQGKMTVRVDKLMQVTDFLGYHLELIKNEPEIFKKLNAKDEE